jgi:hypothetical protein
MTCFRYRDQQAVPCYTRRRLVAKAALGVVTGAENRDLFWDAVCGKRDADRRRKQSVYEVLCTGMSAARSTGTMDFVDIVYCKRRLEARKKRWKGF